MKQLSQEQINNLPEWMTIPDYPSYEVNCRAGLVRNLGTLRVKKPILDTHGYPSVGLHKDGKAWLKSVHRLVANAAFGYYNIPTDGLFACHLDEERHNPRIDNLALATNKENLNFPKAKQRNAEAKRGEKNPNFNKHLSEATRKKISDAQPKKAVAAYKNGKLTLIFNSLRLVNVYGFNSGTVCRCCNGKLKTHKGYVWRFLGTTDTPTAMTVNN